MKCTHCGKGIVPHMKPLCLDCWPLYDQGALPHIKADRPDLTLGRLATASSHWEWSVGMRVHVIHAGRHIGDDRMELSLGTPRPLMWSMNVDDREFVPDFTDPGTRGCLLALSRKAWGVPFSPVYTYNLKQKPHWTLYGLESHKYTGGIPFGPSESEEAALVLALTRAPQIPHTS